MADQNNWFWQGRHFLINNDLQYQSADCTAASAPRREVVFRKERASRIAHASILVEEVRAGSRSFGSGGGGRFPFGAEVRIFARQEFDIFKPHSVLRGY